MKSDVSSMAVGASVAVVTAVGGGAAAPWAGAPRPHAADMRAATTAEMAKSDRTSPPDLG